MSIAFSQASSARIEAARHEGMANAARQADLSIWGVYVQARARGDAALATYVEKRFTPHFEVAYRAWIAEGEPTLGPLQDEGTSHLERPRPRLRISAPRPLRVRSGTTSARTTTPSSPCSSRWSCSSPLRRLGCRPRAQWILLGGAITFPS